MIKNLIKKLKNKTNINLNSLTNNLTVDTLESENRVLERRIEEFIKNPNKKFKKSSEQGEYFEKFIAAVFEYAGYKVKLTPINDNGIDIYAENNQSKYLIQCKNYNIMNYKAKLVGVSEVREFNGVTESGEKLLITTSYFTGYVNKKDFKDIVFVDRSGIPDLLEKLVPTIYKKYIKELEENFKGDLCKNCKKGILVNKKKYNKEFLGCSNYPNCKYSEKK